MTRARITRIAGRQFFRCANRPGSALHNLSHHACPSWARADAAGGFDSGGCIIDHVIPWAISGDDGDGNLQALCPTCHAAKTKEDNDDIRAHKELRAQAVQEAAARLEEARAEASRAAAEAQRASDRAAAAQRELEEASADVVVSKRARTQPPDDAKAQQQAPHCSMSSSARPVRTATGCARMPGCVGRCNCAAGGPAPPTALVDGGRESRADAHVSAAAKAAENGVRTQGPARTRPAAEAVGAALFYDLVWDAAGVPAEWALNMLRLLRFKGEPLRAWSLQLRRALARAPTAAAAAAKGDEKAETYAGLCAGREHYHCRVQLPQKMRARPLRKSLLAQCRVPVWVRPTCAEAGRMKRFHYELDDAGRIGAPWRDRPPPPPPPPPPTRKRKAADGNPCPDCSGTGHATTAAAPLATAAPPREPAAATRTAPPVAASPARPPLGVATAATLAAPSAPARLTWAAFAARGGQAGARGTTALIVPGYCVPLRPVYDKLLGLVGRPGLETAGEDD
jgi:hypothetical protein